MQDSPDTFPRIRPAGLSGLLVRFADTLSEPANRAALAFRAAVEAEAWEGVEETSSSLVSTFLRFDPLALPHDELRARIEALLARRDWQSAPLPGGRRAWRIPTAFGGELAPGLAPAAEAAGLSPDEAVERLSSARVRVLTIGFAPGQPYLGELGPEWDLPRQQALTPRVPAGALVLAIRQFTLFSAPSPTGWLHVGQTAFRSFRPGTDTPFPLSPGDEVRFAPATPDEVARAERDPAGGATSEAIA